ncbi:MAG: putative DNA-binding domain-containing protein [Pseudomonadota bacterium]
MHAATPDHARLQQAFCAHLRTPQQHAAPADVPPRRMALYRELFRANFSGQLASAFPVLHRISAPAWWDALMEDFFASHRCRSPLFHQLPREFLTYLQQERAATTDDPPFLLELAHYEWAELALAQAEDELPPARQCGDVLQEVPRLSLLAWPFTYHYAVHRIGPSYLPQQADAVPTHLLIYRNRMDEVRFLELNAVSARLLYLIGAADGRDGARLLQQIADELHHPDHAKVLEGGRELLLQLHQQDILL